MAPGTFVLTVLLAGFTTVPMVLRPMESVQTGGATPLAASGQNGPGGLEGTAWRAVDLAGMSVPAQSAAGDREPHLVFGAAGRVSGADGCNRLTGPYTVKGNGITFGQLAGTRMFCPNTDEMTRRFLEALKGSSHWSIVGGRLELYGATGKPFAVFERREPPPSAARLDGTSWQLVKFAGVDDRTLTPDDRSKYTIEFAAGGRLAAQVDCNRGRGTWKATGSQLELGPLALTRMKCAEGSLHDQIVKQWTFVRSFVIKDGHLFLALMATAGFTSSSPCPPGSSRAGLQDSTKPWGQTQV